MDYVVDLYRMKIVSAINNDKKLSWCHFLLLAILSNQAKLLDLFWKYVKSLSFMEKYFKLIRMMILRERKYAGLIRLPYISTYGAANDILLEILEEHKHQLGNLVLHYSKPKMTITINEEKPIVLDEIHDIHFKLQFANLSSDDKNKKPRDRALENNQINDLHNSCGIVFSYTKSPMEISEYLGNRYSKTLRKKQTHLTKLEVLRPNRLNKKMYGTVDFQYVSKTFDNVFLEKNVRDKIMRQLQRFEDEDWFIDRGIPRTLGILLYGSPGCGKTSVIKAIATRFRRSLMTVDFKLVKNWKHLQTIFSQIMYDANVVNSFHSCPHDQVIYIFEDFDCMAQHFLKRTTTSNNDKHEKRKLEQMLSRHQKTMRKLRKSELVRKMRNYSAETKPAETDDDHRPHDHEQDHDTFDSDSDAEDEITLSNFLEILDGVIEMQGRIIVMTTNMRECIDPALIRPGRIDLELELKPPSKEIIEDIFFRMYKDHDASRLQQVWKEHRDFVQDGKFSTAEVINSCMEPDPEDGLRMIAPIDQL
jgi:hypothetical protein